MSSFLQQRPKIGHHPWQSSTSNQPQIKPVWLTPLPRKWDNLADKSFILLAKKGGGTPFGQVLQWRIHSAM
jgi:hypothetical protein